MSRPGRVAAAVAAVALASTALTLTMGPEASASETVNPASNRAKSTILAAASDLATAQTAAREQHSTVEVTSARSETSTTYANPDGTLTVETSLSPVRVKDGDTWAPVDMNLVRTSSGWSPRSSPTPVVFSADGTGPAASLSGGSDERMKLNWEEELQKPEISGATARYSLSGNEDLVLTATPEGFEQSVILKEHPAEATTVELPLTLTGMTLRASELGGYEAVDPDGRSQISIAAPIAYSAAQDPETEEPTQVQGLSTSLTDTEDGQRLDLKAPEKLLNDPDTVYPVTIDPVVASASQFGDTWITKGDATPKYSDHRLAIGVIAGQPARALVRYNEQSFLGSDVTEASLKLRNYFSDSCTKRSVSAYPVSETYDNTKVVWSNQPEVDASTAYKGTASFAYGDEDAGCANNYGVIDVTKMVRGWASGAIPMHGIELRASETDAAQRKYFCSMNLDTTGTTSCSKTRYYPTLSITYNSYPDTAEPPTHAPGSASASATSPGWTTTATPTLRAVVSDPDGGNVRALFDVYNGSTKVINALRGDLVTSPGVSSVAVPSGQLKDGSTYTVRAWSSDDALTSKSQSAGLDAFRVDTTKPAAPKLMSTKYPDQQWVDTTDSDGQIHLSAQVTDTDAESVHWSVNDVSLSRTVSRDGPGTVDLAMKPSPERTTYVVRAQIVDKAGNEGPVAKYTVLKGEGPFQEPMTDLQAGPAASDPGGDVLLVRSTEPTLTVDAGPIPGASVTYDLRISRSGSDDTLVSAEATGTATKTSASWAVPAGTLKPAVNYIFKARVRDATHTGPWSSGMRLIVDLPSTPVGLEVAETGTASWTLSALSARPSDGPFSTRFQLWDANGKALNNGEPFIGTGSDGAPARVQIPDGVLSPGADFQWTAQACVLPDEEASCSTVTARKASRTPALSSLATTEAAISGSRITTRSASTINDDCPAGGCTLASSPLVLGGDSAVFLKIDASEIPTDAGIVSASVDLSGARCANDCSSTDLEVYGTNGSWTGATGSSLAATVSGDYFSTTFSSAAALDITGDVQQWQDDRSGDLGLMIRPDQWLKSAELTLAKAIPAVVTITYAMPSKPSAPTAVNVVPGDHAARVSWTAPDDVWADDAPTFHVTVRDASSAVVSKQDTQDFALIVKDLAPGAGYTATVTSSNAYGTSDPGQKSIFPVLDLAAKTATTRATVADLHTALQRLQTGEAADTDTAVHGLTNADAVIDAVAAHVPALVDVQQTLAAREEDTASIAWSADEQMLGEDPASGQLAMISEWSQKTVTSEKEESTEGEAQGVEMTLLENDQVTAARDLEPEQVDLDDTVTDDAAQQSTESSLKAAAVDGTQSMPASLQIGDDGLPVENGTPDVIIAAASKKSVNNAGTAQWAYAHWDSKPQFHSDCTNFASKALHFGGGMKENSGWYRSDSNWWQNSHRQTFSWAGANHNFKYMSKKVGVNWRTQERQAVPGDILYWDYNANGGMDHVSVVTKMKSGHIYYSQHTRNRVDHNLDKQIRIELQSHPKMKVYVAHMKGS